MKNNNLNLAKSIKTLLAQLQGSDEPLSSKDILSAIKELSKEHEAAVKYEEKVRKMKAEEERIERERKEKEEREARIQKATCMDLPLDWENVFDTDVRVQGVHVDSVSDALILSQNTLGKVDIEYMSAITGKTYKEIITALKGAIYQNPETWGECFYKGWETADEYLTGNLSRKWNIAAEANKTFGGYFTDNMRAIEQVLPETVVSKDIYVTLGSPWVPADIIDDFIVFLLGAIVHHTNKDRGILAIKHDELTGTWEIPIKSRYGKSTLSTSTYGTPRMEALYILEKTLNMKTIVVKDKVPCATTKSGEKWVLNQSETLLAAEKQKLMIEKFQKWVWADEKRKERLVEIYESKFACVRTRTYDGSFLTFPNMSSQVQLYPYQKSAVARILFSKNTLLAHDVGSGKTYVMIAAGMELRRMGLSKKNLFVVPNNIVGQWQKIFLELYPTANILCVSPKDFTPTKREAVLGKIKNNDYDGIVMAYSCFDMIPMTNDYYLEQLKEQKRALEELASDTKKHTSSIDRKLKTTKEEIAKLLEIVVSVTPQTSFDELGITRLFLDEAHNYKNVPVETKADNVLGLSASGSEKCKLMMDKVHYIQKENNGGGVIMATGTPITNSLTDIFVMQKYLQSGELALLDLQSFDAWIGMFAERDTEFEIDVDTSQYRMATRFLKFHNLPELTSLLASIADFHQVRSGGILPTFNGYTDALIGKTDDFSKYLEDISRRADSVRSGLVPRTQDNMLKITTDGRKAALDLRLVNPNTLYNYQSKAARCAENVYKIYDETFAWRSTQLVFCDTSTPKDGFNLYDELARLLVMLGVYRDEIAFVHDATTDSQRNALFEKVRKGEIRVLIGSTFKLGLGVNVQDRLIALHHLDVPWRPADMVQREGRILRQGNRNKTVQIFRYITEGSFDAYSWQLLESKQNFISAILEGSLKDRSGSDVDDAVLSYAEVKALAIGNPLIKKRVETANELSRYVSLQRKSLENKERLEKQYAEMPYRIAETRKKMKEARADMLRYAQNKREYEQDERKELRNRIFEAVKSNVLQATETSVSVYQGFEIVLPSYMMAEKPYIWLKGEGKYYVELGEADRGVLIRIDNFLENLKMLSLRFMDNLTELTSERERMRQELGKEESYIEKIEELKEELKRIDKKLGVK